jgi:hypothetical protein
VRSTPARTATAWITLAHNNCRDPLARSISATAASSRLHPPASRSAITVAASRARRRGVSSAFGDLVEHRLTSRLVVLGNPLTQPPQRRREQLRKLDPQRQIQTRKINQLARQHRQLALAQRPSRPATSRAALRKNATAKLCSDGPRDTPQHRLTFKPLPHTHNSLRPIFAIATSSPPGPVRTRAENATD